jgi:hypothetical protein
MCEYMESELQAHQIVPTIQEQRTESNDSVCSLASSFSMPALATVCRASRSAVLLTDGPSPSSARPEGRQISAISCPRRWGCR